MDNESKKLYDRFLLVWAGQFISFSGTGMTKIRELQELNQAVGDAVDGLNNNVGSGLN